MSNQPYDHVLTEMLQTASELLVQKPDAEWLFWTTFFLTEIQSLAPAQSYINLLVQLQEAIAGQVAELAS